LDITKQAPGYSDLKRVIGVWDDHDYGINDGNRLFEHKLRNRVAFLDFLDEPAGTERRLQSDSPIHQDYYIENGD
jgi:alkaline phosphatase D